MGSSMDWINIDNFDFSIETVLAFYRKNTWLTPDDHIFLAKGPIDSSLYLEMSSTVEFDHEFGQEVRRLNDVDNLEDWFEAQCLYIDRRANSLVELICFYVFDKFEIKAKNRVYQHYYADHIWQWKVNVLSGLDDLLKQHGFEKLWFSGQSRAYQRDDIAIKIKTNEDINYYYTIGADSDELKQTYADLVCQYFKEFDGPLKS